MFKCESIIGIQIESYVMNDNAQSHIIGISTSYLRIVLLLLIYNSTSNVGNAANTSITFEVPTPRLKVRSVFNQRGDALAGGKRVRIVQFCNPQTVSCRSRNLAVPMQDSTNHKIDEL